MAEPILMVDFDETIFNHLEYVEFLGSVIDDRFCTDPKPFTESFEAYHRVRPEVGRSLYSHKKHIKETLGLDWDLVSGVVAEEVRRQGVDFCYPDAHEFLEEATAHLSTVRILTYGKEAYQRYKISLCSEIARLPVHVVEEPKRLFLEREFRQSAGVRGVLIDDRPLLNLPPNWLHVWINRQNDESVKTYSKRRVEVGHLNYHEIAALAILPSLETV